MHNFDSKGNKMFSLKKVSVVVVTSLVAAFYVSANEPVKMAADLAEKGKVELTSLVAKFDKDNNGILSKAEVEISKDKTLLKHFDAIDTNTDLGLSTEELKSFNLLAKK